MSFKNLPLPLLPIKLHRTAKYKDVAFCA